MFFRSIEQVRRFFRVATGFTLLRIEIRMIFTPGPGWVLLLLSLVLPAAEYVSARRLVDQRLGKRHCPARC